MTNLMKASNQWATRPDDERFTSLPNMRDHLRSVRDRSRGIVAPSRHITLVPSADNQGMGVQGEGSRSDPYIPSHWAFGQLASNLAKAPASYLRTLPSPIAADILNYELKVRREVEDVGLLLYAGEDGRELRAATGPNYGRIWNSDVVDALIARFGDGVSGEWRVPGEFGKRIKITKENTTLYASDRDMFVFLADEVNRIEVPNRRNREPGSLARGFFLWNSEVGKSTLGIGTFLFDYVCCNRIVWGAQVLDELRIRHTASAPLKWVDKVQPVLTAYRNGSAKPFEDAIKAAKEKKIDDVNEFLAKRFGPQMVSSLKAIHEMEENRPIENVWDAATAVTAYARGINHIDARVDLEKQAGLLVAA